MLAKRVALPCAAALLIWATVAPADAAESGRALEVADLEALRRVWDPQISPDGKWVVYTVGTVDAAADAHTSDLWATRWDGSETRQLTSTPEPEHSPRWSPDGRRLAFLSARGDAEGAEQLWLLDWAGGGVERVTRLANGVSDFDWAPDSRRAVLVSAVAPDADRDAETPRPIVIDRMLIKRDGYGYLGAARARLHLLDLQKGGVVQLTRAIAQAWSPHGITCNAIGPGFFPTALTASVFADAELARGHAAKTCIGRNGELADLDGATVFLCSSASAYVTGQTLMVDGGYTAR